jgi:hypothetical protein
MRGEAARRAASKMHPVGEMKTQHNTTGVEDRDQWRERIMRALQELRGQESLSDGQMRTEERGDETAAQ